jgi:hypothetical protein
MRLLEVMYGPDDPELYGLPAHFQGYGGAIGLYRRNGT